MALDKEEVKKFIFKIFPNLKNSDFSVVNKNDRSSHLLLLDKNRQRYEITSGLHSHYLGSREDPYYSIELCDSGEYRIVCTSNNFRVKGVHEIMFESYQDISEVSCNSFVDNFENIVKDLKRLSNVLNLNGIDYCKESSRLMDSI